MKAKKKPSFLMIYFTAVIVFLLLSTVFFVVMAVMLNNYEANAESKRIAAHQASESARIAAEEARAAEEESRAAESERIQRELESERAKAEKDFINRQNTVQNAAMSAAEEIKSAAKKLENSGSAAYVSALAARLDKEGSSVLTALCSGGLSAYEPEDAVAALYDGTPGKYNYEMTSELSARITKGSLYFEITLEKTLKDGYIPEYSLTGAECSVVYRSYTVTAPDGADVTVNGKAVTETPRKENAAAAKDVPAVFAPPRAAVYELNGFINAPTVSATLGGTALQCLVTDGAFEFPFPAADKEITDLYAAELSGRLLELTFKYTDFIAGVFKFDEIKDGIYKNAKLYKTLSGFDNRWYYTFDHIENENAKISNITVLSDRLVSARVSYDQMLYDENGKRLRKVSMKFDVITGCPSEPAVPDPDDADKLYPGWLLICVESV